MKLSTGVILVATQRTLHGGWRRWLASLAWARHQQSITAWAEPGLERAGQLGTRQRSQYQREPREAPPKVFYLQSHRQLLCTSRFDFRLAFALILPQTYDV
eukprot:5989629-Amphidinium_carterae.2